MNGRTTRKNLLLIFLLLLFSIPSILPLLQKGLPDTSDGEMHVARAAAIFQGVTNGQFPLVRWAENLNFGFGHPVLIFQYPLPSYLGAIFHLFGGSFVDGVKLVAIISTLTSATFFYLWLRGYLGEKGSFVGSLLYLYAPYRFVDLYDRLSIGEVTVFAVAPLVFLLIDRLIDNRNWKNFTFVAFTYALLVLSHNVLSILFSAAIIPYTCLRYFQKNKSPKGIIIYILPIIFGLGITAFFWLPALFEARYTTRDLFTASIYKTHFAELKEFIITPPTRTSLRIGYPQIATIVITPLFLLQLRKRIHPKFLLVFFFFSVSIFSIFMMLPISRSLWEKLPLLAQFQYPLRFLALTSFSTAFLGGVLVDTVKPTMYIVTLLIFMLLVINKEEFRVKGYRRLNDNYFENYTGTTTWFGENNTIWTAGEAKERAKSQIETVEGDAKIIGLTKQSNKHKFKTESSGKTRIVDNTVYFPGWQVFIDNKKTEIEFQDQKHRGLITFLVPQGNHEVKIIFKESRVRLFSDILSLISISVLLLLNFFKNTRLPKKPLVQYA